MTDDEIDAAIREVTAIVPDSRDRAIYLAGYEAGVEAREKRVAELEAALADERERRKAAEALLHDYSRLANAAMFDANRSGYEYDRKGEMVDARAHFARYKD